MSAAANIVVTNDDVKCNDVKDANNDNVDNKDDDIKDPGDDNNLTYVDVLFVLDCTGSMNPYIKSARDNIVSISNKLDSECTDCSVSYGLVLYRDIPKDYDLSKPDNNVNGFVTQIFDFTSIPFQIELKLHSVDALGGGDQPEALTSALYCCINGNLTWNKDSIKIIIIISDAPPHGLETNVHDDYKNGDINTFTNNINEGIANKTEYLNILDIIATIRNQLHASIYSIVCEPNISCDFDFAHDFYKYISSTTNGKFLPLAKAALLPNVIVGSVKQQISIHNLSTELENEIKKLKQQNNDLSKQEINKLIKNKWKDKHIKKKDISIGTLYRKKRSNYNVKLLMDDQQIKTLNDFKKNAKLIPRYKLKDFRHLNTNKNNNSPSIPSISSDNHDNDNDNNMDVMNQSFNSLLSNGHDIDGIDAFLNDKNNIKHSANSYNKILVSWLQKKSRFLGAWRKRYVLLSIK